MVLLALGDSFAAIGFVSVGLRAPTVAGGAHAFTTVRAISSFSVSIRTTIDRGPLAAPVMAIPVFLLTVLHAPQHLLEGTATGLFGVDGLELGGPDKTWSDLFPRVVGLEWRFQVLDVGPKFVNGSSLLALSVLILIGTFRLPFLKL